jgi:hypothetical protein
MPGVLKYIDINTKVEMPGNLKYIDNNTTRRVALPGNLNSSIKNNSNISKVEMPGVLKYIDINNIVEMPGNVNNNELVFFGFSKSRSLRLSLIPFTHEVSRFMLELCNIENPSVDKIKDFIKFNQDFSCLQLSKLNKGKSADNRKKQTNSYGLCGMEILWQFYYRRIENVTTNSVRPLDYTIEKERKSFLEFLKYLNRVITHTGAKRSLAEMISWVNSYAYQEKDNIKLLKHSYWWTDDFYHYIPSNPAIPYVYFAVTPGDYEWLTVQKYYASPKLNNFFFAEIEEMIKTQCYFQFADKHFFPMVEETSFVVDQRRLEEALNDLSLAILKQLQARMCLGMI